MVQIPPAYPPPTEEAIATFDFQDIASGTGFVNYLLMSNEDSAATEYVLSDSVLYSDDIVIGYSNTESSTPFSKRVDTDFDLTSFVFPRTVKGTALINIPWLTGSDGANAWEGYLIIRLRKWDGSSEAEIASVQTKTLSQAGVGAESVGVFSVNMPVPRTHFKRAETLRITVEIWARVAGSAASINFNYGIDPKDRANDIGGTSFILTTSNILIPYEVSS